MPAIPILFLATALSLPEGSKNLSAPKNPCLRQSRRSSLSHRNIILKLVTCSVLRRLFGPPSHVKLISMSFKFVSHEHLPIVHTRFPSTGLIDSSKSFPYRHNPASKRNESRAPSPAGLISG
jgi:hypothetical protein